MNQLHLSSKGLSTAQVNTVLEALNLPKPQHIEINQQHTCIELPPENKRPKATVIHALRALSAIHKFDFAIVEKKIQAHEFKLLAMDMDSTLIAIECIDEIADFAGKKKEVSEITEAAMRGEITDFSESLNRRVALLKGIHENCLHSVFKERLHLSPGAEELIQHAKANRWKTLLVSGGFTFFTDKIQQMLELDFSRSNTLEIIDGYLTGRVLGTIVDANIKRDTVLDTCRLIGCTASQTIAIGDGSNDLKMMEISGASIAFHAKPVVQEKSDFSINHGGLDTVCRWFSTSQ